MTKELNESMQEMFWMALPDIPEELSTWSIFKVGALRDYTAEIETIKEYPQRMFDLESISVIVGKIELCYVLFSGQECFQELNAFWHAWLQAIKSVNGE